MKRAANFQRIWHECHGILAAGSRIAIAGAGISGLHLAEALAARKYAVTVFDPHPNGGVRIPMMHACHTIKKRAPLWENAAAYDRAWYRVREKEAGAIFEKGNEFGAYFIIRTRFYLRWLRQRLKTSGVEFVQRHIALGEAPLPGFDLACIAAGAATQVLTATRIVAGWESYFAAPGEPAEAAILGKNGGRITNYMLLNKRAGFIHRNGEDRESAEKLGKEIHPTGRHALFHDARLTTRDRFPIVGFLAAPKTSAFLFCAMGYHALTYTPYLANAVAAQLAGETPVDENLICTLTPARFLPREGAQGSRPAKAAPKSSL